MTTTMSLTLAPPDRPPTLLAAARAVADARSSGACAPRRSSCSASSRRTLPPDLPLRLRRHDRRRGHRLLNFLVPASSPHVLFSNIDTTTRIAEDAAAGLADRLRSLRFPGVVLAGRNLADAGLLSIIVVVTAVVGFTVGSRPGGPRGRPRARLRALPRLRPGPGLAVPGARPGGQQRPGAAGPLDDRLPAHVRVERLRTGHHDASLDAALPPPPAGHGDGRRHPLADAR